MKLMTPWLDSLLQSLWFFKFEFGTICICGCWMSIMGAWSIPCCIACGCTCGCMACIACGCSCTVGCVACGCCLGEAFWIDDLNHMKITWKSESLHITSFTSLTIWLCRCQVASIAAPVGKSITSTLNKKLHNSLSLLQKQLILATHLRVLIWQKPCVGLGIGWCLSLWIPRQTAGWQKKLKLLKSQTTHSNKVTRRREMLLFKATKIYKSRNKVSKFPKRFQNQRLLLDFCLRYRLHRSKVATRVEGCKGGRQHRMLRCIGPGDVGTDDKDGTSWMTSLDTSRCFLIFDM